MRASCLSANETKQYQEWKPPKYFSCKNNIDLSNTLNAPRDFACYSTSTSNLSEKNAIESRYAYAWFNDITNLVIPLRKVLLQVLQKGMNIGSDTVEHSFHIAAT